MDSDVRTLDELTLGSSIGLDDIVDRSALREMVESFYRLFRVPLRLFGEGAGLLAQAGAENELYVYLRRFPGARASVDQTISNIANWLPEAGSDGSYECFTGASYRVASLDLDARRVGRIVLGPFLPPTITSVRRDVLGLDPGLDAGELRRLLESLPRAKPETVAQIVRHLQKTLDLILFSGHKALLTSNMHLLSVREGFKELEEKNERLQEAFDRLQELDRLKSNFLATVSHELRTPLTSIIGYSEMLKEGLAGTLSEEQRAFVTTIFEKGNQLLDLISGMLDLTKLESGTLQMRSSQVDVEKLVEDVVATLTPAARKAGVKLSMAVEPAIPSLRGDPTRLRQVCLNLVDNALKFTDAGGAVEISARVTQLQLEPDGQDGLVVLLAKQPAVELVVKDTGIGVADEEKTKVFAPFYQVDSGSTRQVGGTGLGLSIVQRIVEAHQGKVEIRDNVPKGTAFVVTIPLRHLTLS